MKKALLATGSLLALLLLYLMLWPVAIDPVAWDAPVNEGPVDPFGPDDRLKRARSIDLGDHHGPEDATLGHDGKLYATAANGMVLQIDSSDGPEQIIDVFVLAVPLGAVLHPPVPKVFWLEIKAHAATAVNANRSFKQVL
jgi:hypothetical protein